MGCVPFFDLVNKILLVDWCFLGREFLKVLKGLTTKKSISKEFTKMGFSFAI